MRDYVRDEMHKENNLALFTAHYARISSVLASFSIRAPEQEVIATSTPSLAPLDG